MSDNRGPKYMPTPERIRRMCHLIRRTRCFRERLGREQTIDYGVPVRMSGVPDDLSDNRMFVSNLPTNEGN